MQAREGPHTGWVVYEWAGASPSVAIRSKLGIRSSGLP